MTTEEVEKLTQSLTSFIVSGRARRIRDLEEDSAE
jgi:hypothetical protein